MADDSKLRAYAAARDLGWRWRTWKDATHWHASADLRDRAGRKASVGTSTIEGEQVALDYVTALVIRHWEPQPVRGETINMWTGR